MTTVSIICMLFILSLIAGVGEVWVFVLFGVVAFVLVGFFGGMLQGVAEFFGYNPEAQNEQYKELRERDRRMKETEQRGNHKEAIDIYWQSLDKEMKKSYWDSYRNIRKKCGLPLDEDASLDNPPEEMYSFII